MGDHCLVTSGEWSCSDDGKWDFLIDKHQMSRIVPIRVGITLDELKTNVLREFFGQECEGISVGLSYWPPNNKEMSSNPPVLLTNDGSISFFLKHLSLSSSVNLLVKFSRDLRKTGVSEVDDNVSGFKTPLPTKRTHLSKSGRGLVSSSAGKGAAFPSGSTGASKFKSIALDDNFRINQERNTLFNEQSPTVVLKESEGFDSFSSAGSKCKASNGNDSVTRKQKRNSLSGDQAPDISFDLGIDDTELITEVENHEGNFKSDAFNVDDSVNTKRKRNSLFAETGGPSTSSGDQVPHCSFDLGFDDAELITEVEKHEASEEGVPREIDPSDLRPRGYDQDFWSPLLDNQYGGSNAAEVVCGLDDPKHGQPTNEWIPPTSGQGNMDAANNQPWSPKDGQEPLFSHGQDSVDTKYNTSPTPNAGNLPTGCSRSAYSKRPTKLQDLDDEEFDLPPMFDDTLYKVDDIPDLDNDDGDESVFEGKAYGSKADCQISLAIYAIKNRFHFKQVTTKHNYFVLQCPEKRCDWRILAHEIGKSGYYEIKKAQLTHTCSILTRNGYRQKASSRVIAAVYKAKYGDPINGPKSAELQQLVLEDLRVSASYMKCYRAKGIAATQLWGNEEESYKKLPEYLHMLKLANPGTVADIETEKDENGNSRFLYLFLAFGASIVGWRQLRPVLIIDGTHLSGRFKGVLLTACGQDANFQVFPLAFAVVDSENDDSWTWFLQKLERIVADSNTLTIISDRHNSINTAITRVYPMANHGACIVHIQRNVNSRFRNKGLAKMVGKAAYAFTAGAFRQHFEKVKTTNLECAKYLIDIGVGHWARSFFPGQRYNIMTSNAAEQLNKALKKARSSPILELLIFIQRMMTRWFSARRKKSQACYGLAPPEVEKVMNNHMKLTTGSQINPTSTWGCEVIGVFGQKNHVWLNLQKCSCFVYQKYQIPCGHAMLAADKLNLPYQHLIGDCYKPTTWAETYNGVIFPEGNPKDVDIPDTVREMVLLPPKTRRPSGRPKNSRIPSVGEMPVARKPKLVPNKCGRCGGERHNRTTCTNPI